MPVTGHSDSDDVRLQDVLARPDVSRQLNRLTCLEGNEIGGRVVVGWKRIAQGPGRFAARTRSLSDTEVPPRASTGRRICVP